MAVEERIEQTEGGFGSGLRAKMEARNTVEESPRSPGEAVAAATPPPPSADAGLAELRAELEASLTRERALRDSLGEQLDASAREVEFEQEIGARLAQLEQRAATLDERERALGEHERQVDERLVEFDTRHAELERMHAELDATAVRVTEREQSVALKVHELKSADDERAAAAAELAQQVAAIADREKAVAKNEADAAARLRGARGTGRSNHPSSGRSRAGGRSCREGTRRQAQVALRD